jgi:hypothetical protein
MIDQEGAHSAKLEAHLMAKSPTPFSFEDHQLRASAQFVAKKEWLFGSDPDPTYDRLNGWKLDQFAMYFVPDLVRSYKRVMAENHPHAPRGDPFEPRNPWEWMECSSKLSDAIMRRLLDNRFRVEGYPLQSIEVMVIPNALLEHMSPTIETSELREINVPGETARRFERIRVFDLAPVSQSKAGRKPTYDWPKLAKQLEQEKPILTDMAALVAYCRKNVTVIPGKRGNKDGPDDKTIRDAIDQLGLEKFIKSAQ